MGWRIDIVVGLLIGLVGLGVVFAGLQIFYAMLPLIGFFTGFFAGATLITNWLGDGFLSTLTGWIVGLVLGILFALASYLWWYAGALLAAGAAGALLLSGLFSLFGVDNGTVLTLIAIVGAVLFIFAAVVLNLPVYVVLVNTAILGGHMVVGGLLLVFNQIELKHLDWGLGRVIALQSWLWVLVLIVVVILGIFTQLRTMASVRLPQERWIRAGPN